jgi:hypothetical protein
VPDHGTIRVAFGAADDAARRSQAASRRLTDDESAQTAARAWKSDASASADHRTARNPDAAADAGAAWGIAAVIPSDLKA